MWHCAVNMTSEVKNVGTAPSTCGWNNTGCDGDDTDLSTLVFVYGTLKVHEPNHYLLEDPLCGRACLVSQARTVRRFPLVIAGPYNIPYCLNKPDSGLNVCGEVYRVDRVMLDSLDVLEGYPHHYIRLEEEVELMKSSRDDDDGDDVSGSGSVVKAWLYVLDSFNTEHLNKKFLSSYSASGNHQLPYVPRHQRS